MKNLKNAFYIFFFCVISNNSFAQNFNPLTQVLIIDSLTSEPIPGVNVVLGKERFISNKNGIFDFRHPQEKSTLKITAIGYNTQFYEIDKYVSSLIIKLNTSVSAIEEVMVSTGYYSLPMERSTGSFTQISKDDLEKRPGKNILERIEGFAPSVQFIRKDINDENSEAKIRVRGVATILSESSPLIVLNNFPFYGNINSIDPNSVETITILKDAAAASIWGAKAGNGVIVITTKNGKAGNEHEFNFKINTKISEKPNIYEIQSFIPSEEYVALEKKLFEQRFYSENNWTTLSPIVELLISKREGIISDIEFESIIDKYKKLDFREHVNKYIYQTPYTIDYVGNMNGGSEKNLYFISGGIHNGKSSIKHNSISKYQFLVSDIYNVNPNITLSINLNYSNTKSKNEGILLGDIVPTGKSQALPYTQLIDDEGRPNMVIKNSTIREKWLNSDNANHLIDWGYYPLLDKESRNHENMSEDLLISSSFKYHLAKGMDFSISYKYESNIKHNFLDYGPQSYFIRNLVNIHAQKDGTKPYPQIGYRDDSFQHFQSQNGRLQINSKHHLNALDLFVYALGGVEVGQNILNQNRKMLHGFNPETYTLIPNLDNVSRYSTNPRGSQAKLPQTTMNLDEYVNRDMSLFTNISLSLKSKYYLTGSARWDASNLFGVQSNQKGVPLYSVGFGWNIHNEDLLNINPDINLRWNITYGLSGNTNKNVSAFTVINHGVNNTTGLPIASINSIGNPKLRWEKIKTLNTSLSGGFLNHKINFVIEVYKKIGNDLIGNVLTDMTSGWDSEFDRQMLMNYADILTKGGEIELSANYSISKFNLSSIISFSYSKNRVLKYNSKLPSAMSSYAGSTFYPMQGYSVDQLYSLPWFGLDPNNGFPLVPDENGLFGSSTQNHSTFLRNLKFDDLIKNGVSIPPYQLFLNQNLKYKNLSFYGSISGKFGYFFRKSSIHYYRLFNNWEMHMDYLNRWKNPGDELNTNIPAMPQVANNNSDSVYTLSEKLIENGNHIRLNELRMSYNFPISLKSKTNKADIYIQGSNLGILWKASNSSIDPDFTSMNIAPGKKIVLGIEFKF